MVRLAWGDSWQSLLFAMDPIDTTDVCIQDGKSNVAFYFIFELCKIVADGFLSPFSPPAVTTTRQRFLTDNRCGKGFDTCKVSLPMLQGSICYMNVFEMNNDKWIHYLQRCDATTLFKTLRHWWFGGLWGKVGNDLQIWVMWNRKALSRDRTHNLIASKFVHRLIRNRRVEASPSKLVL